MQMRYGLSLASSIAALVVACGSSDEGQELFGGTGATASGGTAGGAGLGGGKSGGNGGNTGGTDAGTGGDGGTSTGGVAGSDNGGSAGSGTGGTAGAPSGGGGAPSGGGGAPSGGGGTGGDAGSCPTWCLDFDNDKFGIASTTTVSCSKPSGNWVEMGSKPNACGDCQDQNDDVYPGSNHCSATGYLTNGGVSFDYNCDGNQLACSDFPKAGTCAPDPVHPAKCIGAGYLKANISAANPYCGSDQFQNCGGVVVGPEAGIIVCAPVVSTYNPVTCK